MPATLTAPSVASQVRVWVDAAPPDSILDARSAPGAPSNAARVALSRLANGPGAPIVFIRRHAYWKPSTASQQVGADPVPRGMGVLQAALHLAGPGAGMSGYSAARMFGWTDQMVIFPEIAVVGRVPRGFEGAVTIRGRGNDRRRALTQTEVSLLEAVLGFIKTDGYDILYRPGHSHWCDWEPHQDEASCYWGWGDALQRLRDHLCMSPQACQQVQPSRLAFASQAERRYGRALRSKVSDLCDLVHDERRAA